jgi:hypothetical protein
MDEKNTLGTLREWINNNGDDAFGVGKTVEPLLDLKVVREVSSVRMDDYDEYLVELRKSGIKTRNCHCFMVLENGQVVGFNENPARGWSYPLGKKLKLS